MIYFKLLTHKINKVSFAVLQKEYKDNLSIQNLRAFCLDIKQLTV